MAKRLTVKQIRDNQIAKREVLIRDEPESNWVQSFYMDLAKFKKISPREIILFQQMSYRIDRENIIYLNTALREKLIEEVGYKDASVLATRINSLKRSGLLMSIRRDTYMVNPYYFSKGTLFDIRTKKDTFKSLTLNIKHTPDKKPSVSINVETARKAKKETKRVLRAVKNPLKTVGNQTGT